MREREQRFLLEGPIAVREALTLGVPLEDLFLAQDADELNDIRALSAAAGMSPLEVGDPVLRSITDAASHQGVVAIASMPKLEIGDLPADSGPVLVLAEVRDPGNAGTLIRTAAALGAAAVVFPKGAADPFGPKTVRASAGVVLRLPIVRGIELRAALEALHEQGFRVLGAEASATHLVYETELTGRIAIVLGNEAGGISREAADLLDETLSIPMPGDVESLNVAVAGTIFLSEAWRQRRLSSAPDG